MSEIYIFDQDDHLLTPLTYSTGLVNTWFKDHLNKVPEEPFVFTVESDTEESKFVQEDNQVAFRDKDGDYRLYVIKEIDDADGMDGPQTVATCFPAFLVELKKKFIVERRFTEQYAQKALDATLEGTRWIGVVSADLGKASTHFYHMLSVNAIWQIQEVWGGDFKDIVTFNGNKITSREIHILQRLGTDNGHRFEIDHNVEEIARTVISNPVTALYGYGASLEVEDEDGAATGGFTRYINFADVEWKISNGDPVDKPKGQAWVGDPDALERYGLLHEGRRLHLENEFSDQDYEDPKELLQATWEQLQKIKDPEVNYRLAVRLLERLPGFEHEKVSLGDTSRAIDRKFSRPIEIQARIIALEYDIMDIEGTAIAEMGQFLSVHEYDDRLDRAIETIRDIQGDLKTDKKINEDSFPDIKPSVPANVQVEGAFQSIQLYWEFNAELFVKNYEVYGSQVKGFAPDTQHLLHRGPLNGFNHVVETDQVWYYRIRAVNYQGRASDYTAEYSGSTVRIKSDDILFGPELAADLRELSKVADILAPGSVDLENMKQEALDKINESAREYSQEEIQKVADSIRQELTDKVDASKYEEGINNLQNHLSSVQIQVDEEVERLTSISNSLIGKVEENREALEASSGRLIDISEEVDTISGRLSTTIESLSIMDNTITEQRTLIDQQASRIDFMASRDSVDELTGRIESTEASITILDDRITSKAEAKDVYTKTEINTSLGKKVDTSIYNSKMSQLDVAVSGISAEVRSISSEVNSFDTKLVDVQSQLNIQAGLIEAKAEKNEVYTKTEANGKVSTEISKVRADFKVTTDGISQSVTSVSAKIDDLVIGGTNLAKGTALQSFVNYSNARISYTNDNPTYITRATNISGNKIFGLAQAAEYRGMKLVKGKVYTLSFEARGNVNSLNYTYIMNDGDSNQSIYYEGDSTLSSESDFKKLIFTFTYNREGSGSYIMISSSNDGHVVGDWFEIRKLKLEEGSKAGGWSLAVEDITSSIGEVKQYATSIDQRADSISLSVDSLHSSLQSVNSEVSKITLDIGKISTSVREMENGIRNIGGANLVPNTDFRNVDDWMSWYSSSTLRLQAFADGSPGIRLDMKDVASNPRMRLVASPSSMAYLVKGRTYTISFIFNPSVKLEMFEMLALYNFSYDDPNQRNWTNFPDVRVSDCPIYNAEEGSRKFTYTFTADQTCGARLSIGFGLRNPRMDNSTWVVIGKIQIEEGSLGTSWSPSVVDMSNRVSSTETRIDQTSKELAFKASADEVNNLTGRMSKAESTLSVQSKQIEAKVDSNGVIAAINLQPGTVKIKGNLLDLIGDVYINNGRTYISTAAIKTAAIANGAITRAKLGTAVIGEAQIENGAITNAKIYSLSADKVSFGVLRGIQVTAVDISSSKFSSTNGNNTTLIQGGYLESSGRYTRTWRGSRKTHQVDMRFENGYLRARNNTENWSLYFMDSGISTFADGSGGEEASGTLAFRDTFYSEANARGVTLHSYYGVVALSSEENRVVLDAKSSVNIESQQSGIYLRPMRDTRIGNNEFRFAVKDNGSPSDTDGWIAFGSPLTEYAAGIRFQRPPPDFQQSMSPMGTVI